MTWSKMRDDLIAQTKAFVQSVNDGKPQLKAEPVPAAAGPIKNSFAQPVSVSVADATRSEESFAVKPIEQAEQTSYLPPPPAFGDVRTEIQVRVAAFQAHQHRFRREREAYFNSVLTKVRADIENGPDAATL